MLWMISIRTERYFATGITDMELSHCECTHSSELVMILIGICRMLTSSADDEDKILDRKWKCTMHPVIITGTVCLSCNWLWGRYHVPQNVFLVVNKTHI